MTGPDISVAEPEPRPALDDAEDLGSLAQRGRTSFRACRGRGSLWIVARTGAHDVAALRAGYDERLLDVTRIDAPDGPVVFECNSPRGAWRVKVAFPVADEAMVRCTTSLIPAGDTSVPYWPRDLVMLDPAGTVHTKQRGLRTGVVFASTDQPLGVTMLYLQDFSALNDYFQATERTPSGCVGGDWPFLGYAPPAGEGCVLPKSRETIVSDAYLTVRDGAPPDDGAAAGLYLDLLAATYTCLNRPPVAYHDWPERATRTLRDLTLSPECTELRSGLRYLMPYVGDRAKPPESMVQLTLAVNATEYDQWRGQSAALTAALRANVPSFFDDDIGTLVRWLPGADFGPSQAEANMNHEDMDSWYLHHALFNVSRFAAGGDDVAKDLLRRSLPFVIRVARRFAYRWPIFFNMRTLDIVRAESEPGKGGENDVSGLYALLMLHAHELFGDAEYFAEAERAAVKLQGLGFNLGYQMNTTGFAAEAAMRLWKATGRRVYLDLSEICMANLFDNMLLWRCEYGRAQHYPSFFGLFPLHDAPYLAAYEELEAHAKFHEYFALGGDDIRPSLRLLMAEYQRHSLDRCWYYYPDALPAGVLAGEVRNGALRRELAVPIEDLQDGREASGQVGQEIYGAGLAFVMSSRHYRELAGSGCVVYCNYPMYDFASAGTAGATWRAEGDPRCECELRVIPTDPEMQPIVVTASTNAGDVSVPLRGKHTAEGHAAFVARGGQTIRLGWTASTAPAAKRDHGVEIGGLGRMRAER